MKKIYFKILVVSAVVVLMFNSIFIVAVAFIFEKEAEINNYTQLEEILKNDNKNLSYEDFVLLNWAYSTDGAKSATKLPEIVKNAEYIRCSRVESVVVQLLQTKNNSIIQLFPKSVIKDINIGSTNSASFVRICGVYYLIVGVTEKKDLFSAVYKTKNDLSGLYDFETDKNRYSSYEFYPFSLAPLFYSTFDKILNVFFVFGEIAVTYFVLVKKARKTD